MHTFALQQVSSKNARSNADGTLHKPIALKFVAPYIEATLLDSLEASCTDGAVFVWGSKPERSHQTFKVLGKGALFLFRRGTNIYKYAVAVEKTVNPKLAEALWGRDDDGELWSTIYFFAHVRDKVMPASRVNELLKRSPRDHWQGLVVLSMKESEKVDAFFQQQLTEL